MRWIDDLLLDRVYQPLCDRLDADCVAIARDTLLSYIVLTALHFGLRFIMLTTLSIISHGVILAAHGIIVGSVAMLRHIILPLLGRKGANPLRVAWLPVRLFFVIMYVVSLGIILPITNFHDLFDTLDTALEIIRDLALLSGLYFASCHNRPPLWQQRVVHATV